jgi:hypothetical protein
MGEFRNDSFFSLLVEMSDSAESKALMSFVEKYFENRETKPPANPVEVVLNLMMVIETINETLAELETLSETEEEKIELLMYRHLVLKALVVITYLDFFSGVLKETNLYNEVCSFREKVKSDLTAKAAKLKFEIKE